MRLHNNTIVKSAIVLATIIVATIIATSTATFADAEVNINTDGTMSNIRPPFPARWGPPPLRQTRDYVQLPAPYGRGSSTIKKWIEEKMAEDAAAADEGADEGTERRFADPSESTSSTWPDKSLVGMTGEEAEKEINDVDPSLDVHVLPEDSMVTMDYVETRVRVFVGTDGKVARQPNKG
jgi:hypothetical protein